MTVLKRRAAVERWKATHREYYLAQKRQLASRPEYLAHRRAVSMHPIPWPVTMETLARRRTIAWKERAQATFYSVMTQIHVRTTHVSLACASPHTTTAQGALQSSAATSATCLATPETTLSARSVW